MYRKYGYFMRIPCLIAVVFLTAAPLRAEITNEKYVKVRDEMKSLYLVQGLLSWFERVYGERSVFQDSYKGHEDLFTKDNIKLVDKLIKDDKTLTDDDRLAARFLRTTLTLEYVGIDTAHFGDEISNAETTTTVTLPWSAEPVAYRQLDVLMDQEKDPDRRQQIFEAQAGVWKDILNPIHERAEMRERELVRELGYNNIVEISQELRMVNLKELIDKSQKLISETDMLYKDLFREQLMEVMGITPEQFHRSDTGFFASVPEFKKFFPPEITVPAFLDFLEGMGLDMSTKAGTEIKLDDEIRDAKEARAACYSMTVPDDVRITVKPSGGIPDFDTFFHEGGHALHFANSTTPVWEFQQLGNNAITETYAGFFEGVWGDPEWLMHYREFVKLYNKFQEPSKRVPVMTDQDIAKLIRNRVFWDLYFVRRYNGAKLIYESILHEGDPSLWKGYYSGQTADLQQVYKTLFSDAYGYQLTDKDALRFRTDVDSFFYAADYSRSFILSAQIDEYMRGKFGAKWFMDPRAGAAMRDMFAFANKWQPANLAAYLGQQPVDPELFIARMNYRLKAADALIKGGS